jgi:hypothetical protein
VQSRHGWGAISMILADPATTGPFSGQDDKKYHEVNASWAHSSIHKTGSPLRLAIHGRQLCFQGFLKYDHQLMTNDDLLANQKRILGNQEKILSNQEEIKTNQTKLDRVLGNQEKILANQAQIEANQTKLASVLDNQEKILANQELDREMIEQLNTVRKS